MIVFNLSCDNNHLFEGWFDSAASFDSQQQSQLLSCPVCGTGQVTKELHAPYVNTGAPRRASKSQQVTHQQTMQKARSKAFAQLVDHLIANTDDVGDAFPEEARKIHYQEVPERAIRGNATPDEVVDLRDEGIEVVAVPVPKHRLGNTH